MAHESATPCCSANAVDVLLFRLFRLDAHLFLHPRRLCAETLVTSPSSSGTALSGGPSAVDAIEPCRPALRLARLCAGLMGRGEKVPWSHGPSWTCSPTAMKPRSSAVVSAGSVCAAEGGRSSGPTSRPLGWGGTWSKVEDGGLLARGPAGGRDDKDDMAPEDGGLGAGARDAVRPDEITVGVGGSGARDAHRSCLVDTPKWPSVRVRRGPRGCEVGATGVNTRWDDDD